eukprot:CAMPEP_0202892076 /NCGR_PEP_ID=MMETSP1392-20130828/1917_1 /ASSEMBLY_ACC=CAM_ASM_000868 /TAXON_ID=225041 /ORGANISM="Chlamydomonas chlamydogama, Strain SAG 11-48b" /LENGTH=325 /DNA_ID=CAMNT_0049575955 /DNA_START=171 /DNA_END=1148 /DNA_ORIENTATION=+
MATYKAIQIQEQGGIDKMKLVNLEKPVPTGTDVLIRNAFGSVNYIDTYHRSGLYPVNLPFTVGVDGAGTVEAVGEGVQDLKPGDRVAWFARSGGYAEYALSPASKVVKVPDALSLEQAVTCMVQGMTAVSLVTMVYEVKAGDYVLVHAAAGGTGQLIVQLASALGAHVIGTTSTPEKARVAQAAGARDVILYTQASVEEEVARITGGRGVAVVYDGVGKDTFSSSLKSLGLLGTLASFGNASGKVPAVELFQLTNNNIKLMRPSLFEFIKQDEGAFRALATRTFKYVLDGTLRVSIHKVFPLAEAAKAHEEIEGRKTVGKILLKT